MKTANELLPKITLLLLTMLMGLMVGTIYWLFWPYRIITIQDLRVAESTIGPGDFLVFKMDYCKNRAFADTPSIVQYSFVSGDTSYPRFGGRISLIPSGCTSIVEALRVPILPAGSYRLEMIRTYRVNPARDMTVRATSNSFIIRRRVVLAPSPDGTR